MGLILNETFATGIPGSFATSRVQGGSLSVAHNAGAQAVDLSIGLFHALWDLTSQTAYPQGEFEAELEVLSGDLYGSHYAGVRLIDPATAGLNGVQAGHDLNYVMRIWTGVTAFATVSEVTTYPLLNRFFSGAGSANATVKLLLLGNGTHGSTTFTDSAPSPKTMTRFGTPTITTSVSMFGGSSIVVPPTSWVGTTNTSVLDFGLDDFTVGFWVRLDATALVSTKVFLTNWTGSVSSSSAYFAAVGGVPLIRFYTPTGTFFDLNGPKLTVDTWYRITTVRRDNFLRLYYDTQLVAELYVGRTAINTPTGPFRLGAENAAGDGSSGTAYFDDVFVVRGMGIEDAAILAPTAELSATLPSTPADKRVFNVRWDNNTASDVCTIEFRVDGVLMGTNTGRYPALRPSIFLYGCAVRLNYVKLWDAPAVALAQPAQGGRSGIPTRNLTPNLISTPLPAHRAAETISARLGTFQTGGQGYVYGTTAEKGTPDVLVSRRVCLIDELSRQTIAEKWSTPGTGAYEFRNLRMDRTFTVVSYDHTGAFRAVVADGQIPERMPL